MDTKQVIIIRKDLKMRRGKEVAQGSHASMGAILGMGTYNENTFSVTLPPDALYWLKDKFKKICVTVDSEAELKALYAQAKAAGLPTSLILDSGLTEFGGVPTYTAAAIGPAFSEKIDPITKHLKLY